MIESLRFALIVFITALDYIAHEAVESFNATRDFVRYRARWIVRDKVRMLWSRRR